MPTHSFLPTSRAVLLALLCSAALPLAALQYASPQMPADTADTQAQCEALIAQSDNLLKGNSSFPPDLVMIAAHGMAPGRLLVLARERLNAKQHFTSCVLFLGAAIEFQSSSVPADASKRRNAVYMAQTEEKIATGKKIGFLDKTIRATDSLNTDPPVSPADIATYLGGGPQQGYGQTAYAQQGGYPQQPSYPGAAYPQAQPGGGYPQAQPGVAYPQAEPNAPTGAYPSAGSYPQTYPQSGGQAYPQADPNQQQAYPQQQGANQAYPGTQPAASTYPQAQGTDPNAAYAQAYPNTLPQTSPQPQQANYPQTQAPSQAGPAPYPTAQPAAPVYTPGPAQQSYPAATPASPQTSASSYPAASSYAAPSAVSSNSPQPARRSGTPSSAAAPPPVQPYAATQSTATASSVPGYAVPGSTSATPPARPAAPAYAGAPAYAAARPAIDPAASAHMQFVLQHRSVSGTPGACSGNWPTATATSQSCADALFAQGERERAANNCPAAFIDYENAARAAQSAGSFPAMSQRLGPARAACQTKPHK